MHAYELDPADLKALVVLVCCRWSQVMCAAQVLARDTWLNPTSGPPLLRGGLSSTLAQAASGSTSSAVLYIPGEQVSSGL